jgi:hypothetical protein
MGKQTGMAFRSSRYGWLILAGMLIVPVGITRYSVWKREQAEMERMKDPAYAEAKRKEQAEWQKIRSAMKTLEAQRGAGASSATGATPRRVVVTMMDYQRIAKGMSYDQSPPSLERRELNSVDLTWRGTRQLSLLQNSTKPLK